MSSWLEKNKDPLNDTLVGVLKASQSNALLQELWSDYETQEEQAAKSAKGGGLLSLITFGLAIFSKPDRECGLWVFL